MVCAAQLISKSELVRPGMSALQSVSDFRVIRKWSLFSTFLAATLASAAPFSHTLHSRSGQFVVSGVPIMTPSYAASTAAVSFVRLDPALVAVSCESIKRALLDELGLIDQWQGNVSINIHPVREDNEPIDVTSVHYRNKWQYRVDIGEQIDRARFIGAIVEVVLFEIANRNARDRQAELPPWLVPGLARHLEATSLAGLTLEPRSALVGKVRNADALARVRESLRGRSVLNIDQLNWPGDEPKSEEQNALYERCAQLLVYDLLRLKNGRACMADMLKSLHLCLNWQTAFFHSFGGHFERLVDLDKWWSLRVVQIYQKEPFAAFTMSELSRQLDDILETTTLTGRNSNGPPVATVVPLQTIIVEWEPERQSDALRQKISLLRALHTRANGPTARLIADYAVTLDEYLQRKHHGTPAQGRNINLTGTSRIFAQVAVNRLNALDARRKALAKSVVPAAFKGRVESR